MRRRGFLVGCASALAAPLAGCTDGGTESDGGGGDDGGQSDPQVEDALGSAVGEANLAAAALAAARENAEGPTDLELDVATQEERLESARSALDDAEERDGAAAYETELEAARHYVDAVAGLVEASAALIAAADPLAELETAISEEDYERADELLATAEPETGTAVEAATGAQENLDAFDAAVLDPYGAQTAQLEEGAATVAELATAADAVASGYRDVLDGRDRIDAGREAWSASDYGGAAEEFDASTASFESARTTFESAREDTDTDLDPQLETAACRASNLEEAGTNFADGAEIAEEHGLGAADTEVREAQDALERVSEC